jgi:LPS-assembly lipoprotein
MIGRCGKLAGRLLLLLAAFVSIGGCGFHPLYESAADGSTGPAQAGLAQVAVGLIPERAGQLLRQALQARLERGGSGIAARYDLAISYAISGEALAIQPDSSVSRIRLVGSASWSLTAQDPQRRTLTSGVARAFDAYNIINSQLFAADLDNEAVQRRLANAVADQLTLQLASWFDKQAGL